MMGFENFLGGSCLWFKTSFVGGLFKGLLRDFTLVASAD